MGLSLITPPTAEPITLSEARAQCSVDGTIHDAMLATYILAARQWAEAYTHKTLMTQTWDYTIDYCWPVVWAGGYWSHAIELPLPPLQSVTSINYIDENGATQLLASNQYVVIKDKPAGLIVRAYGVSWPAVRHQVAAITVRMVCGFGTNPGDTPDDVRTSMLLHVEMLFDRDPNTRETLEQTRDSLISGNQSVRIS